MTWRDHSQAWLYACLLVAQGAAAQGVSVQGPVTLAIGKEGCTPGLAGAHAFPLEIVATSPPELPAAGWRLELSAEGAARVDGSSTVHVPSGASPLRRRVCVAFTVHGLGIGAVNAALRPAGDAASASWQPVATIFVLQAPDVVLTNESSPLELWRAWLRRELSLGRLSPAEHDRQLTRLLERGTLTFPSRN